MAIEGAAKQRRLPAGQRKKQIVEVTRDLMINEGYDAITLRAVAKGCGISLAGVQHFYPDKASLIEAMIDAVAAEYDALYHDLANIEDDTSRLDGFVRWIVCEEIAKPETAGFFFEMWRLAHRDPVAKRAVARLYERQLERMAHLVQRANANLTTREAAARASIIMGSTDGFMNTIGFGKTRPAPLRDVADDRLVELLIAFALM